MPWRSYHSITTGASAAFLKSPWYRTAAATTDLSVVVLNRLTLRYGLVLRRSQNTTLLPTALLGHAGCLQQGPSPVAA
jgi:hypothetical protein